VWWSTGGGYRGISGPAGKIRARARVQAYHTPTDIRFIGIVRYFINIITRVSRRDTSFGSGRVYIVVYKHTLHRYSAGDCDGGSGGGSDPYRMTYGRRATRARPLYNII